MTAAALLAGALCGLSVLLLLRPGSPAFGAAPVSATSSAPSGVTTVPRPDPPVFSPVLLSLGAATGAWFLVGGWPGVLVGLVVAATSWRVLARMEPPAVRRRREALERDIPLVVDLMAASLSAGSAPAAALGRLVEVVDPPLREELRAPVARLRLGADPVAVWADLARHPQLGPLGRCLLRAAETGASVSDALQELSTELRHRGRAEVEARARAVAVKASAPLGLCLLPAFVLLGIVPLVAGLLPILLGR